MNMFSTIQEVKGVSKDPHDTQSRNVTALYERLSRDDELTSESLSISNQKTYLEDYALDQGFTNCRHYTDDGYSGGNFDRPGWKQLIADIEAGIVKTVIVKDMSRVGRNHIETGFYTEIYFAKIGVRFIAINNGIDTANPDSTEFAGILNIMNEWYLKDQARKTRSAALLKGKSGKPLTVNPCFGYVKDPADKDHWLIDPEAADTVRRIFELAASGYSQIEICRTMIQEGRVTPGHYHGKRHPNGYGRPYVNQPPFHWSLSSVTNIIQRREYLGETVNFKQRSRNQESETAGVSKQDMCIFPGTHEPIVEPEVWEAAQQLIRRRKKRKPCDAPSVYMGLIVCSECGVRMGFQRCTKNPAANAFACQTYKQSICYDHRICVSNSVREAAVDRIVKDVIRHVSRYAMADEECFRNLVMEQARLSSSDSTKALEKRIRSMEKRIAELDYMLKRVYEDSALGRMTEERFEKLAAAYEQEQRDLKEKLSTKQAELQEARMKADCTDRFLALAKRYRDCTEVTDEMIRAFIQKIVVHPTIRDANGQKKRKIEVHLNFIGQFVVPSEVREQEDEQ